MNRQPEICYEDFSRGEATITGGLPFININEGNMPSVLFMYESRKIEEETLEREIILHSYANMLQLKSALSPELYDQVREALGLMPLKKAEDLGSEINEQINSNLENAKKIVGQQGDA